MFSGNTPFLQLARETLSFWVKAFSEDTAKRLENFGFIQFRPGGITCFYFYFYFYFGWGGDIFVQCKD